MKTTKHTVLAIMIVVAAMLAACNNIEHGIDVPENEYVLDINNYVSDNFFNLTENIPVEITVKSPFVATILKGNAYSVDNTAREKGRFTVTAEEIPMYSFDKNAAYADNPYGNIPAYTPEKGLYSLTRDFTIYIRPFEMQTITGYGWFNYPVRIRQRGADGTYYLTGEQIRKWKNDHTTAHDEWFGDYDNHYIKATVLNVGEIEKEEGIYSANTSIGPLWNVPATGQSYGEAQCLEARMLTLSVDGEQLNIKVHYPECYNLLSKADYKTGDTVEVFIPNTGIITGSDIIWVSPLDILKL